MHDDLGKILAGALGAVLICLFVVSYANPILTKTIVLCKGLSSEYVVTVTDFRKEADGFSGMDTKGHRQYYMKDNNDTCITMDEELYNKEKRGN